MWERGSKYNDGTPEIHASSIGKHNFTIYLSIWINRLTSTLRIHRHGQISTRSHQRLQLIRRERSVVECCVRRYRCTQSQSKHFRNDAPQREQFKSMQLIPFESLFLILIYLQGVDASLIPTLSFPAFASHEERLVDLTKSNVINRLRGKRGFKRFSRDGYLSRHEDHSRR